MVVEVGQADADKAEAFTTIRLTCEQGPGRAEDFLGELGRFGQRDAPGERTEIAGLEFQRDDDTHHTG